VTVGSRDEIEQLRPPAATSLSPDRSTATMDESDWPLVQALAEDGRASYRRLAGRTHWHESTVRRRVEELTTSGMLFFDLDVPLDVVGINSPALLWMNVMPAKLTEIGQALASRPKIRFVAATTGTTTLLVSLVCHNDHSLYEYLTRDVATLDGITHIETAPVTRLVKLYTTLTAPA
jgi:DNA-binding Lrp family transcriptional regulator